MSSINLHGSEILFYSTDKGKCRFLSTSTLNKTITLEGYLTKNDLQKLKDILNEMYEIGMNNKRREISDAYNLFLKALES